MTAARPAPDVEFDLFGDSQTRGFRNSCHRLFGTFGVTADTPSKFPL
ncbi:hypothetical protein OCK02_21445 [Rhizobium sp. TRM96647]|nr:hypothetical protein [Rhizobium sp. TRM96647]MCV3738752.1 hypothetical protein [Rhizobium sp. TRM96647]